MYDISQLANWVGRNHDLTRAEVWYALFFDFGDAPLRFLEWRRLWHMGG